jgi:hypothetical protein
VLELCSDSRGDQIDLVVGIMAPALNADEPRCHRVLDVSADTIGTDAASCECRIVPSAQQLCKM